MLNVQAIEYKSPEFTLDIVVTGVGVDIRLNDISVDFDTDGGHSTMTYDVNQMVIAGVNEIKVITFPFFENTPPYHQTKNYHSEAEVIVSLYVNEKSNSDAKEILSQIHLKPQTPSDKVVNLSMKIKELADIELDNTHQSLLYPDFPISQQMTVTRKSLSVQNNYPRWAWQDGQIIKSNQKNYDSLLAAYREIYEAYRSKNRNKLFQLQNEAAEEFALAYALTGGIAEGHAFIETAEMLDNPDAELYEFFTDGLNLEVFADGKMARIVDIANYHPVLFTHKTLDIIYTLKFSFYKNKQDEWVMIR